MLQLRNLYIQYGDRKLLNRVSFTIKNKDRIGLVGRNGAGKSTLLKIIAGEVKPDEGGIDMPSLTTIGFLHQDIFIPEDKTIMEEALTAFDDVKKMQTRLDEITLAMENTTDYESDSYMKLLEELSDLSERMQILDGGTIESKAQLILMGLGFKDSDMDRMIKEFSGGWKMRVELAKILLRQPDYMLLDEPTNHLDIESILWLENFLKTYPGCIVTISHDKTFLDNVTNKTIEIELGKIYEYNCPYSKFLIERQERRTMLKAQFENQQKVIAEKERTIERFRAKANKAKMAQSMIKELGRMERIELDLEDSSSLKIRLLPAPRIGAMVFKTNNISKSYGDLKVLDEAELQIERNEKIAFVGQNGQGKTTLAKIIAGSIKASSGDLTFGHNVLLGYYAQDQADSLDPSITVLKTMENVAINEMRTKVRSILGAFMFSGEDVEKKVSVLSGGERARLALAKLLLQPINLLILDEPTNHLDILAKQVLKEALIQYDGTMIVVSHDRDFLQDLTDRTVEFRDKKLYNYIGDVYAFLDKRKAENMREVEMASVKNKSIIKKNVSPSDRNKDREIQKLEKKIINIENLLKNFEAKMGVDGFYENKSSEKIMEEYNTAKNNLKMHYKKWEEMAS